MLEASQQTTRWRSMFYFNIYRLVLAVVLVMFSTYGDIFGTLSPRYPWVFSATAYTMMVLSTLYFITINAGRPGIGVQMHSHTVIDLVAIALLIHASEGFQSGYGFLMIVSVAAISLLDTQRTGIAYAAFGTILSLGEEMLSQVSGFTDVHNFQGPALIGVGLFSTALVVTSLAARMRASEALARQQDKAIADLDAVNQQIVELLPTGVVAVDDGRRIHICNARARNLLHLDGNIQGTKLDTLAPEIDRHIKNFENNKTHPHELVYQGQSLQPSQLKFGDISLIFLEDLPSEKEQARQMRLAALGRLAAAVAHEVRNPLSAIYQAAQLLNESEALDTEDRQIIEIIKLHSERIDHTVETVLLIGRGDPGTPEQIQLKQWLEAFRQSYCSMQSVKEEFVAIEGEEVKVTFDCQHLNQIMTNLLDNALAHTDHDHKPLVKAVIGLQENSGGPYLEVVDFGDRISEEEQKQLFEPFYSTRSRGTGLGLYISRELCSVNHATLSYRETKTHKAFRLDFPPRLKS